MMFKIGDWGSERRFSALPGKLLEQFKESAVDLVIQPSWFRAGVDQLL